MAKKKPSESQRVAKAEKAASKAGYVLCEATVVHFLLAGRDKAWGGTLQIAFDWRPKNHEVLECFEAMDIDGDLTEDHKLRIACGDFTMHRISFFKKQEGC